MKALHLALLHIDVKHAQPERNRRVLLDSIQQAGEAGAQLILAPEMAISGYSFDNREAIAPFVEQVNGPTLTAVSQLAQSYGVYICIGLALRADRTGIFTNAVVAVDPHGRQVCRYHKINSESRWACPGNPQQDNTFDTPWGRVGVLICSDTYNGLMPRITALRGADLLLVPANWPPTGLNPRELWRARALENGIYLAACNRTGVDRTMDCRQALSCISDPRGRLLLENKTSRSRIFRICLPLAVDGRIESRHRRQRMANRGPQHCHDSYLNMLPIRDLTTFLDLPQTGRLALHCIVPQESVHPVDALLREVQTRSDEVRHLYLLPSLTDSDAALEQVAQTAKDHQVAVALCSSHEAGDRYHLFRDDGENMHRSLPPWPFANGESVPYADLGPARLFMTPFSALAHPEFAVAIAKKGCDVALACEKELSADDLLIARMRTIENLAVAVCSGSRAGIWMPPEGHQQWDETAAAVGQCCHMAIDTGRTRHKRFQDRVDFDVLLGR
jgi:predicted amidohydrolase